MSRGQRGCTAPKTSVQVTEINATPLAPAAAQERASSMIARTRSEVEGMILSKTAALWCCQSDQAMRVAMEARPRRREAGEAFKTVDNQSKKPDHKLKY